MTLEQLIKIMPYSTSRAGAFVVFLNEAMQEFGIDTPLRQASFIAQVAHESGQLRYTQEIASGAAYEGREDLGNTEPGDGVRFKGRGLIQITGRFNYIACGKALTLDLLTHPELLQEPQSACRSAGWFWTTHGCNPLADANNQVAICKKINGGLNGLDDRLAFFKKAKEVLVC